MTEPLTGRKTPADPSVSVDCPHTVNWTFRNGGAASPPTCRSTCASNCPAGGKWMPRLEYPRQGDSRIQLDPIDIDPQQDAPIELRVPGGRISGQVVGPQKTPVGAAVVHLLRGDESGLVASASTGNDGRFDLIGIAPGSYKIHADGNRVATPRTTPLELKQDETKELTDEKKEKRGS